MTLCQVCRRTLRDPISARRGIGPICWGRLHPEARQQRRQARPRRRSRSAQQLDLPFEKGFGASAPTVGKVRAEMTDQGDQNGKDFQNEHLPVERAVLECWGFAQPDHIRKKHHPHAKSHPATELVALRTGSYTARLCRRCVKSELTHTYPGGLWWTHAGRCAVCGIDVYLNPAQTLQRTREPEPKTKLLCKSSCGRTSRVSARALQKAELEAEREAAETRRQERQRTDQLIAERWPEQEAFK